MLPTVAVLGDALLDVMIVPSQSMRVGGDVPATVEIGPGGQGANVAVRLARSGVRVRLACGLAEDMAGRLLRESLEAEGVEIMAARVPASGAVAVIVGGGDRTMLSHRAPFTHAIDVEGLVRGADWLVVSGYALLEREALALAARCAAPDLRRAVLGCDVPTVHAAEWRAALLATDPDIVFLNADEARGTGLDAQAVGPEALLLVTGRDVVDVSRSGTTVSVRSPASPRGVVDSTGAGDALAAAVIAGLGTRWPPEDELLMAAIADGMEAAQGVVAVAGAQGVIGGERVESV